MQIECSVAVLLKTLLILWVRTHIRMSICLSARFSKDVHLKPVLDKHVQTLIGNDGVDLQFAYVSGTRICEHTGQDGIDEQLASSRGP